MTFTCNGKSTTLPITLRFNGRGWFDRGRSDLKGDGLPDGR
jgi:hypothetical protein